jgi:hypothetical protein
VNELDFDPQVADRMGYPNAVATSTLELGGIVIDLALLEPSSASGEQEWCVVIHSDCDPDDASSGTSGMEPCGKNREAAEAYYLLRIADYAPAAVTGSTLTL